MPSVHAADDRVRLLFVPTCLCCGNTHILPNLTLPRPCVYLHLTSRVLLGQVKAMTPEQSRPLWFTAAVLIV